MVSMRAVLVSWKVGVNIKVNVGQCDPHLSFKTEPTNNFENEANFIIVDYMLSEGHWGTQTTRINRFYIQFTSFQRKDDLMGSEPGASESTRIKAPF